MKRYFALQMGIFSLELSAKIFDKEQERGRPESAYVAVRLRLKAKQLKELL